MEAFMQIIFANNSAKFRPWQPAMGQVYHTAFAFDCETTLIDDQHPELTPTYVIGAAFDGQQGYFLTRERVADFLVLHSNIPIFFHNAAFDLEVIHALAPGLAIYDRVEADQIWDTRLLHKLYTLGVDGHTSSGSGQSKLDYCTEKYLGVSLAKDVKDDDGHDVRKSYGKWLGSAPNKMPSIYLEYLGKDVMATWLVAWSLWPLISQLLLQSHSVWGFVSDTWLTGQMQRWGPQTHHIQLKAEIVLRAITSNGIRVDVSRRTQLLSQLNHSLDALLVGMRSYGYVPGQKGSGKALQEILRGFERRYGWRLPQTPTGMYMKSHEALEEFADREPFIQQYLQYAEIEKLKTSFLAKLGRKRLHPSFNTLMVSGRTSSFGEINAQNLPRDDRVRRCFIPADGHVFLDADYSTLELATLAQCVQTQFNVPSRMADAINAGQDLHRLVAARVTGKAETEVTKAERQKAKPINFGKPGGMGNRGLQQYARASYGVDLSEAEVETLSNTWFALFPEMESFLFGSEISDPGESAARFFQLTPIGHCEHTSSQRFIDQWQNSGRDHLPSGILGWMCLKTLRDEHPSTQKGQLYSTEDIDYFWTRVNACLLDLPTDTRSAITNRRPSLQLSQSVRRFLDRASCLTLTGRLRANASYTARHNTCFQGLAADGAKLALWRLWRAGYRIVNFIHDEVLIELPSDADLTVHANRVKELMIAGMRDVVPDVRIAVECVAADSWSKEAQAVFDGDGKLAVWRSPADTIQCEPARV